MPYYIGGAVGGAVLILGIAALLAYANRQPNLTKPAPQQTQQMDSYDPYGRGPGFSRLPLRAPRGLDFPL